MGGRANGNVFSVLHRWCFGCQGNSWKWSEVFSL